jgi:hypothetical protein
MAAGDRELRVFSAPLRGDSGTMAPEERLEMLPSMRGERRWRKAAGRWTRQRCLPWCPVSRPGRRRQWRCTARRRVRRPSRKARQWPGNVELSRQTPHPPQVEGRVEVEDDLLPAHANEHVPVARHRQAGGLEGVQRRQAELSGRRSEVGDQRPVGSILYTWQV